MAEWRRLCQGAHGVSLEGDDRVLVAVGERHQRIDILETPETFELKSVVVRQSTVASLPDLALRAWRRNRAMQLVGFRIDQKGRLIGEAWVPRVGLTRDEFLITLQRLAAECDLFEFHLTGKDRE
ncbi:MAG: hypothetical protein ABI565_10125 [Vicinamibacteria bacterium]